jgi:DNA topoisomerase-1
LPDKKLGIDLENNFNPTYVVSPNSKKVVSHLKKAVKGMDEL